VKSRRPLVVAATALALIGVAGAAAITAAQQPAPVIVRPARVDEAGRPASAPTPLPTIAGETREQYRQRLLAQAQRAGGQIHDIRQDTRGKPITVGGKTVQLPPDGFVYGMVTDVLCAPGRTCETPFFIIQRGNSQVNVGVHSGRILEERLAPGEERAFDFLKEALR